MKNGKKSVRLTETGILSALAVVFMLFVRLSILPSASFLEYDMGDIPVIIATLFIGPGAGTTVLLFVSLIQAVTVSAASSWQGFIMHFLASEIYVIAVYFIYRKFSSKIGLAASFAVGTLLMTCIMVPLNLIFTPMYMKVPVQAVVDLLLPAIIPFNLLKGLINSFVCYLLYFPLKRILGKTGLL